MMHHLLLIGADEGDELGSGGGVAAKPAVEGGGDGSSGQAFGVEVDPGRDQERGCSLLGGGQITSLGGLDHAQRRPWHILSSAVTVQTVDR